MPARGIKFAATTNGVVTPLLAAEHPQGGSGEANKQLQAMTQAKLLAALGHSESTELVLGWV